MAAGGSEARGDQGPDRGGAGGGADTEEQAQVRDGDSIRRRADRRPLAGACTPASLQSSIRGLSELVCFGLCRWARRPTCKGRALRAGRKVCARSRRTPATGTALTPTTASPSAGRWCAAAPCPRASGSRTATGCRRIGSRGMTRAGGCTRSPTSNSRRARCEPPQDLSLPPQNNCRRQSLARVRARWLCATGGAGGLAQEHARAEDCAQRPVRLEHLHNPAQRELQACGDARSWGVGGGIGGAAGGGKGEGHGAVR